MCSRVTQTKANEECEGQKRRRENQGRAAGSLQLYPALGCLGIGVGVDVKIKGSRDEEKGEDI